MDAKVTEPSNKGAQTVTGKVDGDAAEQLPESKEDLSSGHIPKDIPAKR